MTVPARRRTQLAAFASGALSPSRRAEGSPLQWLKGSRYQRVGGGASRPSTSSSTGAEALRLLHPLISTDVVRRVSLCLKQRRGGCAVSKRWLLERHNGTDR